MPYRHYSIEYPPPGAATFAAPLLLFRPLGGLVETFPRSIAAFVAEMLLVDAVAVWVVAREVARTEGIDRVANRLAWYSAYFAILSPLIVTRFDLAPSTTWSAGSR